MKVHKRNLALRSASLGSGLYSLRLWVRVVLLFLLSGSFIYSHEPKGVLGNFLQIQGGRPTPARILSVKIAPQETDMWCWAACAQMVMRFHQKDVPQCDQANERFQRKDCCEKKESRPCRLPAWPRFKEHGFASSHTDDKKVLDWDDIRDQIALGLPLAYSRIMNDRESSHMLVIRGFSVGSDGRRRLHLLNPLPVGKGDEETIPYENYVSATNYEHHRTYYNIKRL